MFVTPEQKAALIKGASQLLLDVLNKPPEATFVVIDEVDTDNWGWGGLPVLEYRKKLAKDRMASARQVRDRSFKLRHRSTGRHPHSRGAPSRQFRNLAIAKAGRRGMFTADASEAK